MSNKGLEEFIARTGAGWGPISSELVAATQRRLELLTRARPDEPWLCELLRDKPQAKELHRHPQHGFVLLAHTEPKDLYRPPHDHGRSWVIYAVQSGSMVIGTYARVTDPHGSVRLVKRDETFVRAGQAMVYLPGDIHDTRSLSDSTLYFRFTERDLKVEDKVERRLTRYVQQDGVWVPASRELVSA